MNADEQALIEWLRAQRGKLVDRLDADAYWVSKAQQLDAVRRDRCEGLVSTNTSPDAPVRTPGTPGG